MPESTSARVSGSSAAMCRYVKSTRPSRRRGYSGRDRLLHLEQQLGALPDLVDRPGPRTHRGVRLVRKPGANARRLLDDHLVAALHELERARRRQRDAVLVGLDLFGDADPHGGGTIPDLRRAPPHRQRIQRGLEVQPPRTLLVRTGHRHVRSSDACESQGASAPTGGLRLEVELDSEGHGRRGRDWSRGALGRGGPPRRLPRRTTGRRPGRGPCGREAVLRIRAASRRRRPGRSTDPIRRLRDRMAMPSARAPGRVATPRVCDARHHGGAHARPDSTPERQRWACHRVRLRRLRPRDRQTSVSECRPGPDDPGADRADCDVEAMRSRPEQRRRGGAAVDVTVEARCDGDRGLDQPPRAEQANRVGERNGQSTAAELEIRDAQSAQRGADGRNLAVQPAADDRQSRQAVVPRLIVRSCASAWLPPRHGGTRAGRACTGAPSRARLRPRRDRARG